MGAKIAQKGFIFKTFEKFEFLVVNLVGIDTTFEKKKIQNFFHNFLKLVLGVSKNVKIISCFYIGPILRHQAIQSQEI